MTQSFLQAKHNGSAPRVVVGMVASQQEGPGFISRVGRALLCGVCMFFLRLCGFPPGPAVSSTDHQMH